jgi:hypothetical protein
MKVTQRKGSRERDGALLVVGAAVTLIILLIIQSSMSGGPLGTRVKTSTVTSTLALPLPPLKPFVYEWLYDLNSRNATALTQLYTPRANETWTRAPGLSGVYRGQGDIDILFRTEFQKDIYSLAASFGNYSQKTVSGSNVNATFTLNITGNSTLFGKITMAASVSQQWIIAEGGVAQPAWVINNENWSFTSFTEQYPVGL